jgi:hypothetical protein
LSRPGTSLVSVKMAAVMMRHSPRPAMRRDKKNIYEV